MNQWYTAAQKCAGGIGASMASPAGQKNVFRFGLFEADSGSGQLLKQGIHVRLQDQPFRMLMLLLERPGEVVTREELQKALWPGGTVVEFDHGIGTALKKLRQALGDEADHPRYIETLARRGYRWIAGVEWVESAEKPEISKPADEIIDSIAVLPFANLGGDPEQDYFARDSPKRFSTLSRVSLDCALPRGPLLSHSGVKSRTSGKSARRSTSDRFWKVVYVTQTIEFALPCSSSMRALVIICGRKATTAR